MNFGIIGADSTHTENFAGIINRGLAGPRMRVTKLWGANAAQARAKAADTGVDEVVSAPEEVMQGVDAVFVLNRWGPDHFAPAMQAVERGLPLFVDKPLCDDPQEAVTLVRAAAKAGVPLMSASAVRYDSAFRQLLERLPGLGRTRSIMFTLPQNWQLYGVHAVDVMHAVFGVGAVDVTSVRNESGDVVTIRWPDGQSGYRQPGSRRLDGDALRGDWRERLDARRHARGRHHRRLPSHVPGNHQAVPGDAGQRRATHQ